LKPLISVCIPSYQEPKLLDRSLKILSEQTFVDFEVVISDDSNTDELSVLISKYQSKLNLIYFRNQPSLGSPANWNRALDLSSGLYKWVLHHDDWLEGKHCLQVIAEEIQTHPDTELLLVDYWNVSEKNRTKLLHTIDPKILKMLIKDPYSIFPSNFIGPPSSVIFASRIQTYYDPRLKWVVDIDQYVQLLKKAKVVRHLKEPLVCVTNDSEKQTTFTCQGKPEVELFEWPLVGNKLWKDRGRLTWNQVLFFKDLFRVQDVYSIHELEQFFHEKLCPPLKIALCLARWIKRIKG